MMFHQALSAQVLFVFDEAKYWADKVCGYYLVFAKWPISSWGVNVASRYILDHLICLQVFYNPQLTGILLPDIRASCTGHIEIWPGCPTDYVRLWRVLLWRASSSACFSLARFPFLCQPTMIQYSRLFSFFSAKASLACVAYLVVHVSFLRVFSAKKCRLRQFAPKPLY